MSQWQKNRPSPSEETRKKLSEVNKGVVFTEERRKNISEALKSNGSARGQNNPRCKLTEDQVREIRSKYIPKVYDSIMLGKEYNVSSSIIRLIVSRKSWSHVI